MTNLIDLPDDLLDDLTKPQPESPKQVGPVRWFDKEMRCSKRGCGSPTYMRVQAIPLCSIHALRELNEMLVEAGFLGVQ